MKDIAKVEEREKQEEDRARREKEENDRLVRKQKEAEYQKKRREHG